MVYFFNYFQGAIIKTSLVLIFLVLALLKHKQKKINEPNSSVKVQVSYLEEYSIKAKNNSNKTQTQPPPNTGDLINRMTPDHPFDISCFFST